MCLPCFLLLIHSPTHGRDYSHVVGSSSLFPYVISAAELFGKVTEWKTPLVESTGTGGGMKLFCSGVGEQTPDIVSASRPMNDSERQLCAQNNVEFIEFAFGYDGIVLARHRDAADIKITINDLNAILSKNKTTPHPYRVWSDLNKTYGPHKIRILGPPDTSGTKLALYEIMRRFDPTFVMRTDHVYINAADQENVIAQKVMSDVQAIAVMSYTFYKQNEERLKALSINDIQPSRKTIASRQYPLSRKLYLYVKLNHFGYIKGLKEFVHFFASKSIIGQNGLLAKYNFIPLDEHLVQKVHQKIKQESVQ